MDRDISIGNKLCFKKELQRNYQAHLRNMESISQSRMVDCSQPRKYQFLQHNPKRRMREHQHMERIEYENERLLMKMSSDTKITRQRREREAAFFLPRYNKRRLEISR
jgi:hypothetical protein